MGLQQASCYEEATVSSKPMPIRSKPDNIRMQCPLLFLSKHTMAKNSPTILYQKMPLNRKVSLGLPISISHLWLKVQRPRHLLVTTCLLQASTMYKYAPPPKEKAFPQTETKQLL